MNLNDADIMNTKEAAERWGFKTDSSIRQKIGEFPEGTARKFGRDWVVTVEGMEAVFGKEGGDRKVQKKSALSEEEKQSIHEFFESVGFLLGGLKYYFPHIEDTSLYQNLMQSANVRSAEMVRNRIWPVIMDNMFRNIKLDDDVAREHLFRVQTTNFKVSLKDALDGNYTMVMFINASNGKEHFSYFKEKEAE